MSPLIKYVLIFGISGAVIGAFAAPIIISMSGMLHCRGDVIVDENGNIEYPVCMMNPDAFMLLGAILGFVAGAVIGIIFWKLKARRQKKETAA